jgi:hypothetical protein
MGQRTQVLVIKENNKKEKKTYFFHHQWGFGRVMYLGLMDLFMQDYSKETFDKNYDFFDCSFKTNGRFYDVTDEVPKEVLDAADINDLDTIRNVFGYGDNNNGGMVVYIKQQKTEWHTSKFKVGFLLGSEDEEWDERDDNGNLVQHNVGSGKAFERWLTPKEYGVFNGGSDYSDKKFVSMFEKFCRYFNIKYIK